MKIRLYNTDTSKTIMTCTVRDDAEAASVGQSWIEFYKKYKKHEAVAWDVVDVAAPPGSAGQAFAAFMNV